MENFVSDNTARIAPDSLPGTVQMDRYFSYVLGDALKLANTEIARLRERNETLENEKKAIEQRMDEMKHSYEEKIATLGNSQSTSEPNPETSSDEDIFKEIMEENGYRAEVFKKEFKSAMDVFELLVTLSPKKSNKEAVLKSKRNRGPAASHILTGSGISCPTKEMITAVKAKLSSTIRSEGRNNKDGVREQKRISEANRRAAKRRRTSSRNDDMDTDEDFSSTSSTSYTGNSSSSLSSSLS